MKKKRRKLPVEQQVILCLCDLLGIGYHQGKDGLVRLLTDNPDKGSILDRIEALERKADV